MEKQKYTSNTVLSFVKSIVAPDATTIDISTAKGFIQDLLLSMKRVEVTALGAQLAFFFLLSFFPLIIFIVTLLPFLNLPVDQIYDFLKEIMPDTVYVFIESTLAEILTSRNGGLLSIGVLGTIWSASKGINALMRALNMAYSTEGRRGIVDIGLSLVFTVALVGVIAVALVLPVFGQQIGIFMFSFIGIEEDFIIMWKNIRWTMPLLLIFFVLFGLYWLVPNTDPRLKLFSVWSGALFSTIGWLVVTYAFSFYVDNFGNYSATYGSIGGVIVLMLWLYFTGIIFIVGGLLNATMQKRTQAKKKIRD